DGWAGGEQRGDVVEHRAHDGRHARHDVHVADGEAGCGGDRVVDQRGTAWHGGHALPCRVELTGRIGTLHPGPGFRVRFPRYAEGLRDALTGDVVVRRTDAAGGEDVIVHGAELVDRGD